MERRKDSKKRVLKEGEYERANGTYEYKWRDANGKRHSIYAKTLEELRDREDELFRDMMKGISFEAKQLSINDLYNRWKSLKKGLKDNTFQNYIYLYEQFIKPNIGNWKIKDIKKSDVRKFYNMLHDERLLKVSTIDSVHTVLHQVLEIAVEDAFLLVNPADDAMRELKKVHSSEKEKRKKLSIEEEAVFENFLKKNGQYHHWYGIFTTLLGTGLRVGEVTGLTWDDISFEEELINVNKTLVYYKKKNGCGFAINSTKTAAGERIIPMLPKVKEALQIEKKYQEEAGIKCEANVGGYTNFVFVNRFGNVQHQGTLNKALRRIIRDCNYEVMDKNEKVLLPRFSCHNLRHTFTTRLCEAGVNIKAIQSILGHSDAQTTLNIYAEATKELKKRETQKLDEYLKKQIRDSFE